jgi:DNA-binding Xre family transcriptional regulator
VALDYEWRLRVVMAERGIFKASDLRPLLAEHGVLLSESQVWRLVTGKPERLNLHTLIVLCELLGCEIGDLIVKQAARSRSQPAKSEGRTLDKRLQPKPVRLRRQSG